MPILIALVVAGCSASGDAGRKSGLGESCTRTADCVTGARCVAQTCEDADAGPDEDPDGSIDGVDAGPSDEGLQRRYFDELLASGICRAPGSPDGSQIDLSLQILSYTREGTVHLTPNDEVFVDGIPRRVEDELRSEDFEFELPSECNPDEIDPAVFNACAVRADQGGRPLGLSLLGSALRYVPLSHPDHPKQAA